MLDAIALKKMDGLISAPEGQQTVARGKRAARSPWSAPPTDRIPAGMRESL
jgi:hypothetical protein